MNKDYSTRSELASRRTILAEERTLLAQIRTASIFIGVTYIIFHKLHEGQPYLYILLAFILLTIALGNIFSIVLFYKDSGVTINSRNIITIIYGTLLSLMVFISMFHIIYSVIYKKR